MRNTIHKMKPLCKMINIHAMLLLQVLLSRYEVMGSKSFSTEFNFSFDTRSKISMHPECQFDACMELSLQIHKNGVKR